MDRCFIFCYYTCFCHFCLLLFRYACQADIIYIIINFAFGILKPLVGCHDGNLVRKGGLYKGHPVDSGSVTYVSRSGNVQKQIYVDFPDENSIINEIHCNDMKM